MPALSTCPPALMANGVYPAPTRWFTRTHTVPVRRALNAHEPRASPLASGTCPHPQGLGWFILVGLGALFACVPTALIWLDRWGLGAWGRVGVEGGAAGGV